MPATILADRAVIRLSGRETRTFLQGLVTNDVEHGLPVWAALLTPQGKCLFDFLVWEDGDDLLLDCEASATEPLVKRLAMYRLRRPIVIERDETLAVWWSADGEEGVSDPRLPALGRRWVAPPGLRTSPEHNDWVAHRLRLGVCEGAAEVGDLLWLECNAAELNGVSFAKGCFIGQENTARMNWRSKVNRRLVVVEGDGGERTRVAYPELGLAVVHARVDDVPDDAIIPDWLGPALAIAAEPPP
ncbi:YgfZ/GcvT domain-containing protein [Sphingomonas mesophila]|uniref:CAF17-like 4Fe-4S cluster assembly/insertion protein YgfZ n=1 Tax=Sphingomonas mesophila TaxID=2303576 RepID=UPI000E57011A|nr:folate-binding protein YgfZ [Sphingomonas mesophila]